MGVNMILDLHSVQNSRDLGGLTTTDNKRVKYGRIFRTANMAMLDDRDIELLKSYNLKKVLDFRTDDVIANSPNVKIDGVEYIHIPIVKGISSRVTSKGDYENRTMADIYLTFTMDFNGKGFEWMQNFYKNLYSSDYSLSQYKVFFDYLKDNKDGAIIFHCTAGKDRTGVGAILFLTLLGVDREQIINDYLLTNESTRNDIEKAIALGKEREIDDNILYDIPYLNGVCREYAQLVFDYIDTECSSVNEFFKEKMGIDDDYINELKENYLE